MLHNLPTRKFHFTTEYYLGFYMIIIEYIGGHERISSSKKSPKTMMNKHKRSGFKSYRGQGH